MRDAKYTLILEVDLSPLSAVLTLCFLNLCKAHLIASAYEMCCIKTLALSYLEITSHMTNNQMQIQLIICALNENT